MSDVSLADAVERATAQIEEFFKSEGKPMPLPLRVSVQRKNGAKFGQTVLSSIDLDEFVDSETEYAAKVGPGHYSCRITATGSRKALAHVPWEVMPSADAVPSIVPPSPIEKLATATPATPGSPGVTAGPLDATAILLASMQAANQQTAAMMQGMMNMATAAMNRSPAERTPIGELVELYQLIESKKTTADAGGDDSLGRALADALPALVQAFGQSTPAQASPQALRPVATPAATTPATPARELSAEERVAAVLVQRRPDLAEHAELVAYVVTTAGRLVYLGQAQHLDATDTAVNVVETIGPDVVETIAGSATARDLGILLKVAEPKLSMEYAAEVAAAVLNYDEDTEGESDDAAGDTPTGEEQPRGPRTPSGAAGE